MFLILNFFKLIMLIIWLVNFIGLIFVLFKVMLVVRLLCFFDLVKKMFLVMFKDDVIFLSLFFNFFFRFNLFIIF